jgi:hypothetical protein
MNSLKYLWGLQLPYPSTPCGRATPETTLEPVQGWPARRAGGLQPSFTSLNTPCRTPMISAPWAKTSGFDVEGDWVPRSRDGLANGFGKVDFGADQRLATQSRSINTTSFLAAALMPLTDLE